jgi:hypothetical protein
MEMEMLVKPTPSNGPLAVAREIERLRSASDMYFHAGMAGLIVQHGKDVVEAALRLYPSTVARDNVVPLVRKGR